jgi:hypothetical protein
MHERPEDKFLPQSESTGATKGDPADGTEQEAGSHFTDPESGSLLPGEMTIEEQEGWEEMLANFDKIARTEFARLMPMEVAVAASKLLEKAVELRNLAGKAAAWEQQYPDSGGWGRQEGYKLREGQSVRVAVFLISVLPREMREEFIGEGVIPEPYLSDLVSKENTQDHRQ